VFDLAVRLSFPAIIYVFSFLYYQSIKDMVLFGRGFPQLVMYFLLLFATVSLIGDLREWVKERGVAATGATGQSNLAAGSDGSTAVLDRPKIGSLDNPWTKTWIMLVLSAALAWGFMNIGWYTSLTVFLIASFLVLGVKIWPTIVLVVPGLMLSMYLVFDVVLGLRLPGGNPFP
jgi:hypothetical protein